MREWVGNLQDARTQYLHPARAVYSTWSPARDVRCAGRIADSNHAPARCGNERCSRDVTRSGASHGASAAKTDDDRRFADNAS